MRELDLCTGSFYPDNPSAINKDDMKKLEAITIKYIGAIDDVKSVINEYDRIVLPSYRGECREYFVQQVWQNQSSR